jgi:NAD(P)-dependent dehydrogenase (short-subunit alcohol dehydrogenase family)
MPSVFITGASRGIGFEFAKQYSAVGWSVHAGAREPDKADALKSLENPDLEIHRLDVTHHDEIATVAETLAGTPIDLLINNAGMWIGADEAFGRFTDEQWMQQFRLHVFGTMAMCEAFVENVAMSENKLMVNISSGNGCFGIDRGAGLFPYDSSKAALNTVTKGLSCALKSRGITVVSFTPGFVATDMSGPDADLSPEQSISGMRDVISGLDISKSGRFIRYNGVELPW